MTSSLKSISGESYRGTTTAEVLQACLHQQSGKWFINATDCHRLGSGDRQESVNARNLSTSLVTKDKATKNPDTLVRWMKNIIPSAGEYWTGFLSY